VQRVVKVLRSGCGAECSHFDTRVKGWKEEAVRGADKFIVSTLSRAVCFVFMSIFFMHASFSPVAINLSQVCASVARTRDNFTAVVDFSVQIIVNYL
jgi:hypothetical protein